MMRLFRPATLACAIAMTGLVGLAACDRKPGPAEQAGQTLDHVGNKIQDTVDPPTGPAARAGRSIDRATQ